MEYEVARGDVDVRCIWSDAPQRRPVIARDGVAVTPAFLADSACSETHPLCAYDMARIVAASENTVCVYSDTNRLLITHIRGASSASAYPAELFVKGQAKVVGMHVTSASGREHIHIASAEGSTSEVKLTLSSKPLTPVPDAVFEAHSVQGSASAPVVAYSATHSGVRCVCVFGEAARFASIHGNDVLAVVQRGRLAVYDVIRGSSSSPSPGIHFIASARYEVVHAELLCDEWSEVEDRVLDIAWMPSVVGRGVRLIAATESTLFVLDPFGGGRAVLRMPGFGVSRSVLLPLWLPEVQDAAPFAILSREEADPSIALIAFHTLKCKDFKLGVAEAIRTHNIAAAVCLSEAAGAGPELAYEMAWEASPRKHSQVQAYLVHTGERYLKGVCEAAGGSAQCAPATAGALRAVLCLLQDRGVDLDHFLAAFSFASIPAKTPSLKDYSTLLKDLRSDRALISSAKRLAAKGALSRLSHLLSIRTSQWKGIPEAGLIEITTTLPATLPLDAVKDVINVRPQLAILDGEIKFEVKEEGETISEEALKEIAERAAKRAAGLGLYSVAWETARKGGVSEHIVNSACELAALYSTEHSAGRDLLFEGKINPDLMEYSKLHPLIRLCGAVESGADETTVSRLCSASRFQSSRLPNLLMFTKMMRIGKEKLFEIPVKQNQLSRVVHAVYASSALPSEIAECVDRDPDRFHSFLEEMHMIASVDALESVLIRGLLSSGRFQSARGYIGALLAPLRMVGGVTPSEAIRLLTNVANAVAKGAESYLERAECLLDTSNLGTCEDTLALWTEIQEDHQNVLQSNPEIEGEVHEVGRRRSALMEIAHRFPEAAAVVTPGEPKEIISAILASTADLPAADVLAALTKTVLCLGMTRREVTTEVLSFAKKAWRSDLALLCCLNAEGLGQKELHQFAADVLSHFGSNLGYSEWSALTAQAMSTCEDDTALLALVSSFAEKGSLYTTYSTSPLLSDYTAATGVDLGDVVDTMVSHAGSLVAQGATAKETILAEEAVQALQGNEVAVREATVLAERLLRQYLATAQEGPAMEEICGRVVINEAGARLAIMCSEDEEYANMGDTASFSTLSAEETKLRRNIRINEEIEVTTQLLPEATNLLIQHETDLRGEVEREYHVVVSTQISSKFVDLCDILLLLCVDEERLVRDNLLSAQETMRIALPISREEEKLRCDLISEELSGVMSLVVEGEAVGRKAISSEVKSFYKQFLVLLGEGAGAVEIVIKEAARRGKIEARFAVVGGEVGLRDTASYEMRKRGQIEDAEVLQSAELQQRRHLYTHGYHNPAWTLWGKWRVCSAELEEDLTRHTIEVEEERDFARFEIRRDAEQERVCIILSFESLRERWKE